VILLLNTKLSIPESAIRIRSQLIIDQHGFVPVESAALGPVAVLHHGARDYRFWAVNESVMLSGNRMERLHSAVPGGMLFVGPKLETQLRRRVK
jgi:hypothetical protein